MSARDTLIDNSLHPKLQVCECQDKVYIIESDFYTSFEKVDCPCYNHNCANIGGCAVQGRVSKTQYNATKT